MAIESTREDRLLTVAEVAERLRVHPITVRRHIAAGRLRAVRIGRAVRVRASDIEAFLQPRVAKTRAVYRAPSQRQLRRRRKAAERLLAIRDSMEPLGFSTTELIREERDKLARKYDRPAKHRR